MSKTAEPVSGIVVDGQEWTFIGIPTEAFVNTPSPFGDQKDVKLYYVERTEHPPQGGFLSYRRHHKYPFKGIVTPEVLEMVNISKRLLKDGSQFIVKHPLWFGFQALIPFWRKRFLWDLVDWYAEYSFHFLRRFYIKPAMRNYDGCGDCIVRNLSEEDRKAVEEWASAHPKENAYPFVQTLKSFPESKAKGCPGWYSPAPAEFLRVAQKIFWDAKLTTRQRWVVDKVVLSIGMVLECDDSYRYRAQDVFGELNKAAFYVSPSKELARLLKVLRKRGFISQTSNDGVEHRVRAIGQILKVAFLLFPEWKRKAIQFVREVDLNKMRLDEGDWYYCTVRPDYEYGGVPFEKRLEERKKVDGALWPTQVDKQFVEDEPRTA